MYYRFINLAIVTPDAFEIIDRELTPLARKNLVVVARVLQNLFNLSLFTGANDKWMTPLNDWIKAYVFFFIFYIFFLFIFLFFYIFFI